MPRISKSSLHKDRLKEMTDHFSYLISSLSNSQEIENFLNGFLTKEEKIMLAKRLVLLMMLKRNYDHSVIQSALHISYESVRSYANMLPLKNDSFQKILDRLIRREKTKQFWNKIDKILKPFELALEAKTNMKARAKLASGDWS